MGLSPFKLSSCSAVACSDPAAPTTVDPKRFEILRIEQHGPTCVVSVRYPGCSNCEGRKILLMRSTPEELSALKELDPHFCDGSHLSPIARFEPTELGWELATKLAKGLNGPAESALEMNPVYPTFRGFDGDLSFWPAAPPAYDPLWIAVRGALIGLSYALEKKDGVT